MSKVCVLWFSAGQVLIQYMLAIKIKFIIHWLILKVDRIELWKVYINEKLKLTC